MINPASRYYEVGLGACTYTVAASANPMEALEAGEVAGEVVRNIYIDNAGSKASMVSDDKRFCKSSTVTVI